MEITNTFNKIFYDKKILITGHTGFKGSWLTLWLKELGAQILGYSIDIPTKPSHFELLNLDVKSEFADIRDYEKILSVVQSFKPEIVFHLAAQSLVRESYKNPRLTYETNVMGTVNILEACRNCSSVKVIINVTSDKCYENKEIDYAYKEVDPIGGYDPYSSSKGCAELVTSAYRKSFFNPLEYGKTHNLALASVRAGNVIGGGDWAIDRLIPDCIKSLQKNETIIIRNPKAIRPWQHVLEPIYGYLLLASKLYEGKIEIADAWNFGPDRENIVTVEEVVNSLVKLWGSGNYQVISESKMHEAHLLMLDNSKAKRELGWKPKLKFEETIGLVLEWYKKYYFQSKTWENFSIKQINNYLMPENNKF